MTPEQQNQFLSRLRTFADDAARLAADGASLVDQHGAVGGPTTFPDKSGNLADIPDADFVNAITSINNYVAMWNAGNDTNLMKIARFTDE